MTMRDFSCFRDGAVSLASGAGVGGAGGALLDRSLQAATACVYKAALSSGKELVIKVTWTRSTAADPADAGATGLSVAVEDATLVPPNPKKLLPSAAATPRRSLLVTAPQAQPQQQQAVVLLQKKRGSRSFVTDAGTAVAVHWDTSDAKHRHPSSPEPCRDYYLAVVSNGELALLLGGGEPARDLARRFPAPRRRALLVSRREQVRAPPPPPSAATAHSYSTRCRFREDGAEHEVTVACSRGAEEGGGELAVSVDGKKVVEARRVRWNFRGNRTAVLGDGAVVEVMWDVHDWWFPGAAGVHGGAGAQFMVKVRGAADGVWMDEEMASKGLPPAGFFLHLQCYRR
ncbi:uncharacterized protein LOC100821642 [Brachypodium distachyon]|uniref:DUF868 domain-containing protein n=1 Tax=Brachypodium distachyon TaxID=15368 RepID=A0A2K2CT49_BRADI|nr:uncharacterized protein LOC100821642 [Brachypodium distachyon]PNT65193.1 hypothetical protein BRADI_4g38410v3 [Brachypodium distachyon]|eukprot:XP_014758018.1 uncharacterized protein LOC100821642 [Brachypodium distachyon]